MLQSAERCRKDGAPERLHVNEQTSPQGDCRLTYELNADTDYVITRPSPTLFCMSNGVPVTEGHSPISQLVLSTMGVTLYIYQAYSSLYFTANPISLFVSVKGVSGCPIELPILVVLPDTPLKSM